MKGKSIEIISPKSPVEAEMSSMVEINWIASPGVKNVYAQKSFHGKEWYADSAYLPDEDRSYQMEVGNSGFFRLASFYNDITSNVIEVKMKERKHAKQIDL